MRLQFSSDFRKIFGEYLPAQAIDVQVLRHALETVRVCRNLWGLTPPCFWVASPPEHWEKWNRALAEFELTQVHELLFTATQKVHPFWVYLFLDAQFSCCIAAESLPSSGPDQAPRLVGSISFDPHIVEKTAQSLLLHQSQKIQRLLREALHNPHLDKITRQIHRAEATERFASLLTQTQVQQVPVPTSISATVSLSYLEELIGILSDSASGQAGAALLHRVVNAIAHLTDYRLVLVSLFKEEFPYRDLVGCDAIPAEILERIHQIPFPQDEFRQLLHLGEPIQVGMLGQALYFPPRLHHVLERENLYKSPESYTGGQGKWNKNDELFVPIVSQDGEYLGVMSLDDPRSGLAPTEQSVLPVIAFARQISLILERHRVEQEMEGMLIQLSVNNSELAGLNLVLETTSRSMDRHGVLEGALKILDVVDLEAAAILTLDETREQLRLEHVSNVPDSLCRLMYDFGIECFTVGLKTTRGELEIHDLETIHTSLPHLKQTLHREQIQTLVSVPLSGRNGVLGVMVLWSHEKRSFSAPDCRLLANVGKQVGLALETTQLFEHSHRLATQMSALFEVGKSITSHLALKPLLDSVTQNAATLLNADQVSVALLDDSHAVTELTKWIRPIPPGLMVINSDTPPGTPPPTDKTPPNGILLSLPIRTTHPETGEARQIGMFHVGRNSPRQPFSQIEIEMLNNLTTHVSIAVENARAFEAEHKRSKQFRLINTFLREISAILDSEKMLKRAAQVICDNFGYVHVSVHLYHLEAQLVMVRAVVGNQVAVGWNIGDVLPCTQGILHRAIQTKQTVKIDDVRKVKDDLVSIPEARSRLAIPILRGNEVIGVLLLEHSDPGHFDRSDVITAEILADGIGVALRKTELYNEVMLANTQLQEMIRVKDDLVSMVAHDFRSPLTTIQAYSEVLSDQTEDSSTKRYLQIINQQSRHLARLANDTLTMSRLESHKMNFEFQPVYLRELIELVLDSRFVETNVTFETMWPETPIVVSADSGRLQEVFDNLIGNAVKYSPAGGKVVIEGSVQGDIACLSITDQGIGIAKEDLPKLFERFQRMGNARKLRIPGTGLGLYICRSIIEAHNGQIEAESELGTGSTFRVFIPLHQPDKAEISSENERRTETIDSP
ncbi:MAG: GAF domain-containing protein [Acidobacteria bacterium]|nr:GAF domain-containing protein [Acidobacteriota bacterium]